MKKIIKKWGDGLGIYFNKDDSKIYELKEGDIIEFTITYKKSQWQS